MRIIRASEIGTFCFCHRAWWYQINGVKADNQFELTQGLDIHARHNKNIMFLQWLRIIGYALLLIATGILIISFALWLF